MGLEKVYHQRFRSVKSSLKSFEIGDLASRYEIIDFKEISHSKEMINPKGVPKRFHIQKSSVYSF